MAFGEALLRTMRRHKAPTLSDMPVRLQRDWQQLEGWPTWSRILAELGPAGPGQDPWRDTTGWDVSADRAEDVRLWCTPPAGFGPVLAVTTKMAAALARAARGPAKIELEQALLAGIGG